MKIIFGILVLMAFVVSGCELTEMDPQKAGLRPYLVSGGGGGGSGSFCTDSDGGLDYYTRGDCVDSHHASPMNDGCIESNGDNDGFLREITCDDHGNGVMCQMNDYECPYGCFQGVCLYELYEPLDTIYEDVLDMLNDCHVNSQIMSTNYTLMTGNDHCAEGYTCIGTYFSIVENPGNPSYNLTTTLRHDCDDVYEGEHSEYYMQTICCGGYPYT